jgi:hypothetical protein
MHSERWLAGIALTLAGIVGAGALCGTAAAADGEAVFKARCSECHGPRDIQYWGRQRADATARAAWLDQFLRKHYPPPETERALVIDHIQSVIAAAAKR